MLRLKPTAQAKTDRRARGFSLIEVAVILMIIGIAAAFIVPQALAWMRLYRLGVGSRNVATALQRARYLATSNNARAAINITAAQRLRVEQYGQLAGAEAQVLTSIELPNGITIDDQAPRQVAFDGRGIVTPLPNDNVTIRVNSTDGYYQVVVISPTGQVTLADPQKDKT
ncbi:MAG TPA: GspH/FimT family pseudopilin [Blastocatellia bacterium]|nr:GspH/FimT family pseudopilin [Blastocatellia bacterium]